MFDLLPQQERKELLRDYKLRFVSVCLTMLGVLGLLALFVLIPTYFLSHQKELAMRKTDEILKRDIAESSKKTSPELVKILDKEVKLLNSFNLTPHSYEVMDTIVKNRGSRVRVTGFHLVRGEDGSRDVEVAGKADTRNSLLEFVHSLEREKIFKEVTVPVSNFADSENISFSLMIKML